MSEISASESIVEDAFLEYCVSEESRRVTMHQEPYMLSDRAMLRRNFSDPTCASRIFLPGTRTLKRSACDLREYMPAENKWNDVKLRIADALAHDREISRETERENMHFYLSEILISAFEKVAWNKEIEELEESGNLPHFNESPSTSSLGTMKLQKPKKSASLEVEGVRAGSSTFYASVDEMDHFYENTSDSLNDGVDETVSANGSQFSAEATAASLLKVFSASKLSEKFGDANWLVSYAKAPHLLLHLPKEISSNSEELGKDGKPIRLRGSADWAPPRKQWIFSLELAPSSLKQMLELQNNRCAGCGMKICKVYTRRLQLCSYYHKLFCQRCHQGAKMKIPARVIHQWNFREYPVSDIARRFLLDNYTQPVINALAIDSHCYEKFSSLRHVRVLRLQLVHLWSFISFCNVAKSTVTAQGNLHAMYSALPKHFLNDPDVFSMADFEDVKNGNIVRMIEPLVRYGKCHVSSCEICQAKGFVCELCDQRDDLLFPFQLTKVDRCGKCGSLSHNKCAAKRIRQSLPCPKCVRIALNNARHRQQSETFYA